MSLNFEQQLAKPLIEESIDDHLSNSSPYVKGSLGQSVSEPIFSIQFDNYQKTIDFLTEMKLSYSQLKITEYCNEIGSYIFFFNVKIKENKTQWQIRRRLKDVLSLDEDLRCDIKNKKKKIEIRPLKYRDEKAFPSDISDDILIYLEDLLANPEIRSHPILYLFLEYSNTRLETTSAQKIKETYVNKRAGGRFNENKLFLKCGSCCLCWKKRYLIITSEGVLLKTNQMSTEDFRENLSFDHQYSLKYGLEQTGLERGFILHYSSRKLHMEALDIFSYFNILSSLLEAFEASNYNQPPRYGSFAPVRENSVCEWYIDGQSYFEAVYEHLKQAKFEVFITDWWLSPELHLVRPVSMKKNEETRINNILRKLAERNVKIYIIVYREQQIALENDSAHTKQILQGLHPNVKVLRHPNRQFFLWSHHEKILVIDQKYGFLGGLDLCYGRMDNVNHHLFDPNYMEKKSDEEIFFPGIDYTNSRIKDFFQVREYENCRIKKDEVPRMPWHDIAVRVEGDPVVDLCRHFIQYWNFAKYDLDPAMKAQNMLLAKGPANFKTEDRFDAYFTNIKERQDGNDIIEIEEENFIENFEEDKENNAEEILQKLLASPLKKTRKTKNEKESVPVHKLEKVETSTEFIQLINNLRKNQLNPELANPEHSIMPKINEISNKESLIDVKEYKPYRIIPEIKDDDDDLMVSQALKPTIRERLHKFKESFLKPQSSLQESKFYPQLHKYQKPARKISAMKDENIKGKRTEKAKCQILRSASNWSIGLKVKNHEFSILSAYMAMILAAEHFIYIENQFFISTVISSNNNPVMNEIARAIYMRISRAAKEKKKFKVIVVMPLLPGFEGDVYSNNSGLLKIQLYYEYQTISRGGCSLLEMLSKDPNIKNSDDYISFYGLRNHAIMNGKPVTEIIYVHSKLIIVDDKYTLIGSANINDRSMLGDRDSEIAMIMEDQNFVASKMNRVSYLAGEFSHSLRTNIFQEHFGLTFDEVKDPLDENFLKTISQNTEKNTLLYREIFGCYPDDQINKINRNINYVFEPSMINYNQLSEKFIGHAVEFPLKFLCEEYLKFKLMAKERILPDHNFT